MFEVLFNLYSILTHLESFHGKATILNALTIKLMTVKVIDIDSIDFSRWKKLNHIPHYNLWYENVQREVVTWANIKWRMWRDTFAQTGAIKTYFPHPYEPKHFGMKKKIQHIYIQYVNAIDISI